MMKRLPSLIGLLLLVLSAFLFPAKGFCQDSDAQPAEGGNSYNYEKIVNDDPVAARVLTDLGFILLYDAAAVGIGIGFILSDTLNGGFPGGLVLGCLVIGTGGIISPPLAVMTSDAIWGGQGSIGWAWAGTMAGLLAGGAIGAVFYLVDSGLGASVAGILGGVGIITGSILGYELTNKENLESGMISSVRIYPTLQLSKERKTIGVGFQF